MDANSRYDDLVISNSSFTQKVYRFDPGTQIFVRNYDDVVHKLSGGPTKRTIKAGGQPVSVDLATLCCEKANKYNLFLVDAHGDVISSCCVVFATNSAGGLEYEIKKRELLNLNKKQYAEKAVGVGDYGGKMAKGAKRAIIVLTIAMQVRICVYLKIAQALFIPPV